MHSSYVLLLVRSDDRRLGCDVCFAVIYLISHLSLSHLATDCFALRLIRLKSPLAILLVGLPYTR